MITQEQILAQLKLERDKISPLKQVTDRCLEEKAKRLVNKVTEETVLTELVADTIEDIRDTQLTINSVLAEEAKKKPAPPTPPANPPTPPTPPANPEFEEMREMMATLKAEQKTKQITAKKQQILEAAKTKFSETQQSILKTVVEKFNFDFEQADDVLLQAVITETTNFIKNTIGDVTPQNPNGTQKPDDLTNEYAKKAEQYGIVPPKN